jgi:hypothetical protein
MLLTVKLHYGFLKRVWVAGCVCWACASEAQITTRKVPGAWTNLVAGGRFMDRFQAMRGTNLTDKTWGASNVVPRLVDNGIESRETSFWGGNIYAAPDGRFHLFVCGWPENSPKGHHQWPRSFVYQAVSDQAWGPYRVARKIGDGHNPEFFVARDGTFVVYAIDCNFTAKSIDGPWARGKFEFQAHGRRVIEGFSNLTFTKREDGSFLMCCRGGGIWFSETGLSPYFQVTDKRVYPDIAGNFEDPVVWRDEVQYHLIVNDWRGRIAYYLRSKDGVDWVTDPGEAYVPGVISVHPDGRREDWFKYERIKILQDKHGRAVQANFAVIDVLKNEDKGGDQHSSKNISIPLNPGVRLSWVDDAPLTVDTRQIRIRIHAEPGFAPNTDVDVGSLRFGSNLEVNYGRGCQAVKSEADGADMVVTFDAKDHGITADEFAPKLLGKDRQAGLLFGYAKRRDIAYIEPVWCACKPVFNAEKARFEIPVANYGQVASGTAALRMRLDSAVSGEPLERVVSEADVPPLKPFETALVPVVVPPGQRGVERVVSIEIFEGGRPRSSFTFKGKL